MRTTVALFLSAAALTLFPTSALAGPEICQAEPCTDPIGHLTKPLGPIIDLEPTG